MTNPSMDMMFVRLTLNPSIVVRPSFEGIDFSTRLQSLFIYKCQSMDRLLTMQTFEESHKNTVLHDFKLTHSLGSHHDGGALQGNTCQPKFIMANVVSSIVEASIIETSITAWWHIQMHANTVYLYIHSTDFGQTRGTRLATILKIPRDKMTCRTIVKLCLLNNTHSEHSRLHSIWKCDLFSSTKVYNTFP